MSDETYAQACLTPRLGGLGLRKVVEHAGLAYHASWHEAQKTERSVGAARRRSNCPKKTPRLSLLS